MADSEFERQSFQNIEGITDGLFEPIREICYTRDEIRVGPAESILPMPLWDSLFPSGESMKPLPYYTFMSVNLTGGQKTQTCIGVDQNPLMKQNKKRKKKSPHKWLLVAIVGPFPEQSEAKAFSERWRTESRGMASRIRKCETMAKAMGKMIWRINLKSLDKAISEYTPET